MKRIIFSFVLLLLCNVVQLHAEGSVDFIDYPGHRLFLRADKDQQIKVYAEAGEFLNFGASHVGFDGGIISVYRPDGTLHQVYHGNNGDEAIIFNSTQELNGPVGTSANGYTPGVIPVTSATAGVWSLVFTFTQAHTGAAYQNLLNNAPWTRAEHQPTNRRVILSWDVTVSKNNSSPNGGENQSGRVFTNEYNSMISQNGTTTSPRFYVLTKDGLQYSMDFMETDPFGFPISSSSLGLLNADQSATYQSWSEDILVRSDDPTSWTEGNIYQYDPQAEDYEDLINNKIFFNIPDSTMPTQALTTDIFHSNTHITWLFNEPEFFETVFNSFEVVGADEVNVDCMVGDLQAGQGAHFIFDTNIPGRIDLKLDINNDGDTDDEIDIILTGLLDAGVDSIFWDGNDGFGNIVQPQEEFGFNYAYELRGGENHIMLSDVENNTGGIVFELLSDIGADATDNFYYDHTPVSGPVSGGGTPGNALPTNEPFTYDALFGNKKMLDYWAYVVYEDAYAGTITLNIAEDCTPTDQPDSDNDGIVDTVDLDDDNDGISDLMEHCLGQGFACLPGGLDPSGDNDDDGIANYQDADDAAVNNNCTDTNSDGICDDLAAIYDTDSDGVPDHLDLDSDNDGISDLYEANHNQLDADNNGMIDGGNADFGANGFFNILASDADAFDAISVYQPLDHDGDGIMDADDLDSDNDGINDVEEAGHADLDNDGLIDNSPVGVDSYGVAISLNSTLPLPIDTDNDDIPDFHDLDTDNDGINDVEEGGNAAPDNDGIVGLGSPSVNENGQTNDATSNPNDTDNDEIADYRDLDTDNDGINDVEEGGNEDPDNDGIIGTGNPIVNADGQATSAVSNPDDTDGDEIADYRDLDSDNDGINDVIEGGNGDDDNDGIIGDGTPIVNDNGQANGATSNPTDKDGDDIPDYHDLDSDNDGINDVIEGGNPDDDNDGIIGNGTPVINDNGQANGATSNPTDKDGDDIPDYHDLDSDNDGINDVIEGGNGDDDNDGIIGNGTPIVNDNGQANGATSNPTDKDGDDIPDYHDLDSDNDGINDVIEGGNGDDDNDGIIGDGTPIVNDNGQANGATSNPTDKDGDDIPDYHDLDSDNDGINDVIEGGNGDDDNDGIIGIGTPIVNDNGQANGATSNPTDKDGDDIPDYHDLDSDNDGINDVIEGGNPDDDNDGIIGNGTPIVNDNGQADGATSNPDDTDGDDVPDYHDLDSDNDGINDVVEGGNPDEDNDGIIGNGTPIVNDDGQAEGATSNPNDTDGDNIPDYHDLDSDNDGINDVEEGGNEDPDNDGHVGTGIPDVNEDGQPDGTTSDPTDTDMDGIPDYHDLDSDSDGILDVIEGGNDDPDGDGIVGTGTPIVNDMGQPDGSTSNPPDTDLDGIPDYQEAACTGADISILTTSGGGDFCAGDAIVLTATTNLTTGVLNFSWTSSNGSSFNGQATNDADLTWTISPSDVSASGSYSLVVTTEEGCTATSPAIEVNVTAIPNQATITIEDTELCAGEDLILNTTAYTGQNVVYQWFANQNEIATTTVPSLTIENTTSANAGEYHVIIIDGNCASVPSTPVVVTVTEPIGDIEATNNSSADNAICTGGELTLSIPSFENATVEWFGPNGSVGTDFEITLTNVTSEDAGEYYAVVTFDVCGATNSAPTMVYISDNNVTPILAADNDEICANESVELSVVNDLNLEAGDAVIYTWYNEQDELIGTTTENSIIVENLTESGEFYVSVSINGCSANSENYFINVNTLPNETANIPENVIYLCEDETPALLAVAAGTESTGYWTSLGAAVVLNPNDNVTTVTLLEEGANLFVWTLNDDICGDFSSDTVTIYTATDAQAFDDLYTTEQNETTIGDVSTNDNFNANGDYEFALTNTPTEGTLSMNADGTFEYLPAEDFVGVVEFDYTLCNLTCPDDCETANVTLNYQNTNFSDDCFVPNGITPNGDGANDALEVPCLNNNAHPNNHIMIFNRWGDKVHEESGYQNDWYGTYKDKTLPAGTYFYILMIEPGSESIQDFFSIIY